MFQPNIKAIEEAVKELARMVLLAIVPVLIASVQVGNIDWKVVITAGLLALLRGIDSYIHNDPNIKANGISPV